MNTITLFGEVNEDMLEKFDEALQEASDDDLRLHIKLCSIGGDANIALAIAGMMRTSLAEVTVLAMGEVSSAAIMILAAADKRMALKETWFMVHEEQLEVTGSVSQSEREIEQHKRAEIFWSDLMAKYTKASSEYWQSLHSETTYLDSNEALELGLIEEVL